MAQFDREIQRLQAFLNSPSNDMIKTEAAARKLEQLMRLEGWEPGGLSERISALEETVHSLVERVRVLEQRPNIGFGKPE